MTKIIGPTVVHTANITIHVCCSCGVPFGMTADFVSQRLRDHALFYCPNGHSQMYTGKNEAERLRAQLEDAYAQTAEVREALAAEAKAHRAALRNLSRAEKGVCTRCKRTFANVARHMASKHAVQTT